jgi:Domain of unknown function (DUF1877)
MGVRGHLYQIFDFETDRIRADPELAGPIRWAKPWNPTRRGPETQLSMFGLPPRPSPRIWSADLHKSWLDLHRMLNAGRTTDGPLSAAVLGREPLDDAFRLVSRPEVREIAGILTRLDREELLRRFDAMKSEKDDIPDWLESPREDFRELIRYFARLREIYRDASRCDNALLVEIR